MLGSPRSQKPLPLVLVWSLLGAVVLVFSLVFFDMTGRAVARYQAAHGSAGIAGEFTVTHVQAGKSRRCLGTFRPDAGGPVREDVQVHGLDSGECDAGTAVRARLLEEGGGDGFLVDGRDEAFTEGGGGWTTAALVAVLFAVVTTVTGLPWLVLTLLLPLKLLSGLARTDRS